MIDTVAIKHCLVRPPTEDHLCSLGWQPRFHRRGGTICAFVLNEPKGSSEPRLTLSLTPQMEWHFKAEASLPRLLHGANVPLLEETEIESSLRLLSASVERRSGMRFEPDDALVCRVDFARDFHTGEGEIVPTIANLMRVQIPRYDRTQHNDTTVVFTPRGENKSKRISVYGKLAEVMRRNGSEEEQNDARGILRLEVGLRTKAITYLARQRRLNLPGREARHILTRSVANEVLEDAMKKLQFAAVEQSTDDVTEKLLTYFGTSRTKNLLGFLELRRKYGEALSTHKELNYPRRTYFRDLADCRRAGVLPL
jgi:hypothetical protein